MHTDHWAPERIKDFRKAHKLTRKVLGELLGVTVSTVYQWERGLKRPSRTAQILLSKIEGETRGKGGSE